MCSTRTEMCSMHPCLMQRCERCSVALARAQQSPGSFLRMVTKYKANNKHRPRKSPNSPNFAGVCAIACSFQNTESNTKLSSFLLRRGISAPPRCPGSPWDQFSFSSVSRARFSLPQGIMQQKWGWRDATRLSGEAAPAQHSPAPGSWTGCSRGA